MKLVFFLASVLFTSTLSATEVAPWPPMHKAAAIAGCRASIAHHTEFDYLKRSQLTELPPDFREKVAPVMEPYLAVCDCVYEHFERLWTYAYYESHQEEVKSTLKDLMTGACAVQTADPAVTSDSDSPTP